VPTPTGKVADRAEQTQTGELADVLREIAEERGIINRRRFGRWVARHAGRIVGGLVFVRERAIGKVERWRVADSKPAETGVSGVFGVYFGPTGKCVTTQPTEIVSTATDDVEVFE
jgi:hypothetical protein